jgi:hypothetical protein
MPLLRPPRTYRKVETYQLNPQSVSMITDNAANAVNAAKPIQWPAAS